MVVDVTRFRSELDSLDYPWAVSISDTELDAALFKPGPMRFQILEWALQLIDPATQDDFHHTNEENIAEVTTKVLVNQGLCRSADKAAVSGHAPVENQTILWNKVFYEAHLMRDYDRKSKEEKASRTDPFKLLTSLMASTDFWDLLEGKPKLSSVSHANINVGSIKDLETELEKAEEELREASFALNTSEISSSRVTSSLCSSRRSNQTLTSRVEMDPEERAKNIAQQRSKIEDCYKKLMEQFVPALQKRPRDPATDRLSEMVKNLAPKVDAFAQFIKDEDEIKKLTSSLVEKPMPTNISAPDNLSEFVTSMHDNISSILVLIRANQDVVNNVSE